MNSQMIWYVARSSGIVTWALLAASVLWGLALTTKFMGRKPRPAWLLREATNAQEADLKRGLREVLAPAR